MDNLYEHIRQILGTDFKVAQILEREIPLADQMDFIEKSDALKASSFPTTSEISNVAILGELLLRETEELKMMDILVRLANIQSPKAYRLIEDFEQNADGKIKNWAYLALQSLRVKLESFFLEENAILVSSGLGGKDNKLRYFAAFSLLNVDFFTSSQMKVIQSEVYFFSEKNMAVVENIHFFINYVSIEILLPLDISIRSFFADIIHSCAELGLDMNKRMVITNTRKMSNQEVIEYFNQKIE